MEELQDRFIIEDIHPEITAVHVPLEEAPPCINDTSTCMRSKKRTTTCTSESSKPSKKKKTTVNNIKLI